MKLANIISQRNYTHWPSFQIVYEWEDIIAQKLHINISTETKVQRFFHRRFEKNHLVGLYHSLIRNRDEKSLRFIMEARTVQKCILTKNTIPVIIDFWLEEKDLSAFYTAYKVVPLILITNKEVYDFLKMHNCPIPIEHWPLSFPDQHGFYRANNYLKEYDFCIFGRPNPFFIRMLDSYCKSHPDFTYITNNGDINHRCYIDNKGNIIAEDTGRQSYLEMMRKTKVSCYSTPGIDEAKKETNNYNQVTPRLFEMLCSGCHVIGHYPNTADTRWYQLDTIVPNVDNYGQFESELEKMLQTPVDITMIKDFMSRHYTSQRVALLQDILQIYQ